MAKIWQRDRLCIGGIGLAMHPAQILTALKGRTDIGLPV